MRTLVKLLLVLIISAQLLNTIGAEQNDSEPVPAKAAFITVHDLIDQGLYESLQRRSGQAIADGYDYIIFEIDTYGGLIDAADKISMLILNGVAPEAHTVAFVNTRAISAGALIAAGCETILMHRNGIIGDAAPIQMGARLEGVEREKAESFVRSLFERAAQANNHPIPLLLSMVSIGIELDAIMNIETGEYEFYSPDNLPDDPNKYDPDSIQTVVTSDELLTLTAAKAYEFGLSEELTHNRREVLSYLALRDEVSFPEEPTVLLPNWSEQMVRWLNSPAVMSVLILGALLGAYLELSSPGLGLPGLVAAICVVIMVGSRYLTGLANWIDIAALVVGISLILVELFVLPGFGVAGIAGIILTLLGIFGMFIRYEPGEIPWPLTDLDWYTLQQGVLALVLGVSGFLIIVWLLAKSMPKIELFSGMIAKPSVALGTEPAWKDDTPEEFSPVLKLGDIGIAVTALHPVGTARFGEEITDVIAAGEFIEKNAKIEITEIKGNRIVVEKAEC